jgi:RNA polymerase sigma-70 factor (ECF subfamily)
LDEQLLIKQCRQQRRDAQQRLYDTYYPGAYRLSRRYLTGNQDAEDVLVNAFLRVFRYIHEFEYRGEGSLQKWVNTIVINECIRFLSAYKPLFAEEELSALAAERNWTETESGIDTEAVLLILEGMPAGYRTVFNLYAVEGYNHREIGSMLGVTEGTSKSQLSKARNYIIERLNKRCYGTQ